MAEIHPQNQRVADGWNAAPLRAAGLYGELQPLPLPIVAPASSALTPRSRSKQSVAD